MTFMISNCHEAQSYVVAEYRLDIDVASSMYDPQKSTRIRRIMTVVSKQYLFAANQGKLMPKLARSNLVRLLIMQLANDPVGSS